MDKVMKSAPAGERIAKVMARAGLCSRRDAEAVMLLTLRIIEWFLGGVIK